MPWTPFHLGPGLLIGEIFEKQINLIAILLASTLIDVRSAYCLFTGCLSLHGLEHTFIGVIFLAFLITIGVWSFRKLLKKITDLFKIDNNYSLLSIIAGSLTGALGHIILDSFNHFDMVPFWPIKQNFLLGLVGSGMVYFLSTLTLLIGLAVYVHKHHKKP